MNDLEFRSESEKIFLEVEDELDAYDWDFDYDNKGDIFIIYNGTMEYMIMTKNFGRQEIWLVAGKDTFHFAYDKKIWVSTKNRKDHLLGVIRDYLGMVCGEKD